MSARRKVGLHLPLPARVNGIAGRVLVVGTKVAKLDHPDAAAAAGLLTKAHHLMVDAAAKLEA